MSFIDKFTNKGAQARRGKNTADDEMRSIFDEEEPVGMVTDYFPGEAPLMRQLEGRR